ncbi:MAG: hypothetical protein ABI559_07315 [Chloroflexota bacterium]
MTFLALAVAIAALFVALRSTRADEDSDHGNVDCINLIDAQDAMVYLSALAGGDGAPLDCAYQPHTWPPTACDPGPAPSTNCDIVGLDYPTTAPGATLPERLDFNCDRQRNVLDVLAILQYLGLGAPSPTPCASTRPTSDPF